MVDKARGIIEPGSTSVVIPGIPAGATLTVTAYAEDVYGQVSDPVSDTIDTSAEQVTLTDPVAAVPVLTTNTDPNVGAIGAHPFLRSHWQRLIRNGDFHDPPPAPGSPINNTNNVLSGWEKVIVSDVNGVCSIAWETDATSGSNGHAEFTLGAGGNAADDIAIRQFVPMRSTGTRNNAFQAISSWARVSSTNNAIAYMTIQPVLADEVTATGTAVSNFDGFNSITNRAGNIGDLTAPAIIILGTAGVTSANQVLPADAAGVLVTFGVRRNTASTASAWSIDLTDSAVIESAVATLWPDIETPTNAPFGSVYIDGIFYLFDSLGSLMSFNSSARTVNIGGLILPRSSSPSQTADGQVVWDTDDDLLTVGTGSGRKTMLDTTAAAGAYQPLDSDLTAIAALSTTSFGRALLALADAAALRSAAALGTIATQDASAVAITGGTASNLAISNTAVSATLTFGGLTNTSTGSNTGVDLSGAVRQRWNGASDATWHGLLAETGGTVHFVQNVSSTRTLTFKHSSGTEGTAANRIFCPDASDFLLRPGGGCWLVYDGATSQWFIVEQASLRPANNLSDVASASTARTNLGVPATGAITSSGLTMSTGKVLARDSASTGAIEEQSTTGSGNFVRATSPTLTTPALGTPSAVVLTNASGSPTLGTITTTGSIELGHASDTTIARSSAGVVTIEGVTIATYTTGTFTPALAYATVGSSSWATTTATGFYSKTMDRVWINGLYQGVPTNGTGAGNLTMTGLPFTSQNTSNSGSVLSVTFQGYTKANYTQVSGVVNANVTTMLFRTNGSAQNEANLAVGDIPTGGTVIARYSGSYLV